MALFEIKTFIFYLQIPRTNRHQRPIYLGWSCWKDMLKTRDKNIQIKRKIWYSNPSKLFTMLLFECLKRIAFPYNKVLWPDPMPLPLPCKTKYHYMFSFHIINWRNSYRFFSIWGHEFLQGSNGQTLFNHEHALGQLWRKILRPGERFALSEMIFEIFFFICTYPIGNALEEALTISEPHSRKANTLSNSRTWEANHVLLLKS